MSSPTASQSGMQAARPVLNAQRGSNQAGMRAHNERLLLTIVRQKKALPKSDIARMTGLSPQTVSVIVRGLEDEGLLTRQEPVRGKVGQPSVPMALAPSGAFFYGLKIGRRSSELVLVDFAGQIRGRRSLRYAYPLPQEIKAFTRSACTALRTALEPALQARISGMGIATPFQLWNWASFIGAPQEPMDSWRDFDLVAELSEASGCDVIMENDATSACGAELVFGTEPPRNFLHVYLGFFVGGGVVLGGALHKGCFGTAGALGPLPIPAGGAGTRQLLEVASIATLERQINEAGGDGMLLWRSAEHWDMDPDLLQSWVAEAGAALAHAIVAATSIIDLEACRIDGWLPQSVRADLVAATGKGLSKINTTGLRLPRIEPGTVGHDARALGAASLPLSARFLLDQSAVS